MKILFSGGGTLGPVTPLLAMKEVFEKEYPDAEFLWVGSKSGPEGKFVTEKGLRFKTVSSGKFRRYVSLLNVADIFRVLFGFFQSLSLMRKEKPDICISAGGFVSVPVHWAAWFSQIPTWIHQQDVQVGMSNEFMAPIAKKITTVLQRQTSEFDQKKTVWLGNPIRSELLKGSKEAARKAFGLSKDHPVVFITGGGTGSLRLNQLVVQSLEALNDKAQIIHLTGKERSEDLAKNAEKHFENYHVFEFFSDEMKDAYAIADVVVARGGFGSMTEIAALKKPAIFVPKPGHQDQNVQFAIDAGAGISIDEADLRPDALSKEIIRLVEKPREAGIMAEKLHSLFPAAKKEVIIDCLNSVYAKKS